VWRFGEKLEEVQRIEIVVKRCGGVRRSCSIVLRKNKRGWWGTASTRNWSQVLSKCRRGWWSWSAGECK